MTEQSRFATIDLSDPTYEFDNLRFLTFKSPVLQGRGDVTIFIPPDAEAAQSLPMVILLHGVYGSHWNWALKGGAHRTALQMIENKEIPPLVLVMPSDGLWGDGSGYIAHETVDYSAWIVDDVIDCMITALPQVDKQSQVFISGLSMGGFGALLLGAKYPSKFSGISAHSSITHYDQFKIFSRQAMSTYHIANEDDKSVLHWLKQNRDQLPPLRLDCGSTDLLIEYNRELHQALLAENIDHIYEEFDGGHSWAYWSEHLKDSLRFFAGLIAK